MPAKRHSAECERDDASVAMAGVFNVTGRRCVRVCVCAGNEIAKADKLRQFKAKASDNRNSLSRANKFIALFRSKVHVYTFLFKAKGNQNKLTGSASG